MRRKFSSGYAASRVAKTLGMKLGKRGAKTKLTDGRTAWWYTFVKAKKGKKRK